MIRSEALTTATFRTHIANTSWYRIFTQDWTGPDPTHPAYDSFSVSIATSSESGGLFYDGNPNHAAAPGCATPLDLDWRQGSVDLSAYKSQTITMYFNNWNWGSPFWNTYLYLDDVALTN